MISIIDVLSRLWDRHILKKNFEKKKVTKMRVKVMRCEHFDGQRADGSGYSACKVVAICNDGKTALQGVVYDDVCDVNSIKPGEVYDLYTDKNDKFLVFEHIPKNS